MADYGLTWNTDKTKVTLGADVTSFNGGTYSSVKIIDASKVSKNIAIFDNELNNTIYVGNAGSDIYDYYGGDDTIYLGLGSDNVRWLYGNDTIYNFNPNQDALSFVLGSQYYTKNDFTYTISGNDIVINHYLKYVNGISNPRTLTLKNANTNDIITYLSQKIGISKENKPAITWNSDKTSVVLGANFTDKAQMFSVNGTSTKIIDARAITQEVNLYGNVYDNVIYAGSGGGIIDGGRGNDTIYLGNGKDTVSWISSHDASYDTSEGNTVIYNFNPAQDNLVIDIPSNEYGISCSKDRLSYKTLGNDIIITCGLNGCNNILTLKNSNNQATINYLDYEGIRGVNGSTITWNNDKTSVNLNSSYTGTTFNATSTSKLKTINASKVSNKITIIGNSLANTITTGSAGSTITAGKGNDTIYAGAGTDTIQYASGDGADTIYNLSASDKIKFVSDSLKSIAAASTGTDVVINTTNGGKMTLKAATGKTINVVNSAGTTTKYVLGRNDADNSYTWASGVRFIGTAKKDTINLKTGGATVDLTNTTLYKSIDAVSASSATSAVTIKGGAQAVNITGSAYADKITAGSKGDTIRAGKGNDTIYAGAGTDTIQYASGEGSDTIYNLSASDKIKFVSDSLKSIAAASTGTDVVINTTNGGKMTLKAATGKTINVVNSAGTTTKYALGRNDADNTYTWASGVRFVGTAKKDTINLKTGGATVDLTNTTLYKSIDAVTASGATSAVTIKGGTQAVNLTGSAYADKITAGSKGGTITGGKGNDIITAGAGVDTIVIADGMGTDTITGFTASDKIKVTSASYSLAASGSDVIVTAGTGKAVIKSGIGKNIQVVDKNGTTTKYSVGKKDIANTFTWTSGINYVGSSKTDTVNVNTGGANADLSKSSSIEKINASKATKAVTIKGGAFAATITGSAYADKITAGSKGDTIRAGKGNDTIYAGAGTDTIQYASGEGSDTIYNLSATDKIKFVSDSLKSIAAASTGTDVVINTTNGGKMTLKAATGKIVNVVNSAGTTTKYALGRNDADNTYTWASGVRFVGTAKKDTINLKTGGATVDLTNTTLYKSIDAVNASSATSAVTIKGGTQKVTITGSAYADTLTGANVAGGTVSGGAGNDAIRAGSKGGTLIGGKGNDKIYAGAGADIIKFAAGDGNDTIYNYSNSADTIRLTSGSVSSYKVVNGNGVITTNNGTITLNGYTGKSVYVTGSDGVKRTYSTGSTLVDPFKGTSGKDTFTYTYGSGDKTITNYTQNDDVIKLTSGKVDNHYTIAKDVVFVNGKGKITVENGVGKNITVINADGTRGFYLYGDKYENSVIDKYITGKDRIVLNDGYISRYAISGKDVILTRTVDGKIAGTITIKNVAPKDIVVYCNNGAKDTYWFDKKYPIGMSVDSTTKTVKVNNTYEGRTVELDLIPTNVNNIDASATNLDLNLWGNDGNNVIKASQNGSWIFGEGGNDTIYLGAGNDLVWWDGYRDDGNDVVYNFDVSRDQWISFNIFDKLTYYYSGNDVVVNSSDGVTLTFKDLKGQNLSFLSTNDVSYSATGRNSSYQSTLGCLASSVSVTPSSSVMNVSSTSEIAPIGTIMASSSQSDISFLQKRYGIH